MAMPSFSYEEMVLLRILNLNSLQPHYWSELIVLAEQLLSPEERYQLHEMIFDVEKMVFETEFVREEDEKGNLVWVERIRGDLSLYDIEMATESNPDYYSFFQREDGTILSKFDIERRLNRIRTWLFGIVRERSMKRRFRRFG